MLVDLVVKGREAVVVGGGEEAEFKVVKLLDSEARVTVVAARPTEALRELGSAKKIRLVKVRETEEEIARAVGRLEPRVAFVSTGDASLDKKVAAIVRSKGALLCVVDTPELNDINMPAVAVLGDIRVAISTGGKSPAMASLLRKRVEALIRSEDVLQVKLQGRIRREARKHLRDPASRKSFVYSVIEDDRVRALLEKDRYDEAEARALKMLRDAAAGV